MTNILRTIDHQKLGEQLRQARNQCGMSQIDAALAIEESPSILDAIEKGEAQIKATQLIKLTRVYKRTVSEFVGDISLRQLSKKQLIEAFEQGRITEGQFANLLGVDRLKARYLVMEASSEE